MGQIMPPTQPRQAPMPSRPPMPGQPPIPGRPGYNQPPAPGTEHHLHSELRVLHIMEGIQDFDSISKILRTSSTWIEGRSPLYRNANNESHFGESHYSNNSHFSGRPRDHVRSRKNKILDQLLNINFCSFFIFWWP
ncbi:uncharacterized protein [Eurosta solidaginis]|uniref:uncharacterized protein isoform X2 n=1 Tax=Eurosta solidaginis TaxID=178769 RepID=UPI003530879C